MILLDSSVLIDALRKPSARMRQLFIAHNAAICGVTRAEVLHGARSQRELQRLANSLTRFPQIAIPESLWDVVGRNLHAMRAAGLSVPFADALLATVAIENDVELWARDIHYPMIQAVLLQLKLFQEPP